MGPESFYYFRLHVVGPMICTDDLWYRRDWETVRKQAQRDPHPYRIYEVTKMSTMALPLPIANLWFDGLRIVQVPSYPPPNSTAPEGFSGRGQMKKPSRNERGQTYEFRKNTVQITNLLVHNPKFRTNNPVFGVLPRW
jgi:hypothetical protein